MMNRVSESINEIMTDKEILDISMYVELQYFVHKLLYPDDWSELYREVQ